MKNYALLILILLVSVFSLFAQNTEDEQALHNIVNDMATTWTAGDGAGFAKHFADGHEFFVWNGMYMKDITKEQNAGGHQHIFDTEYKDTKHYAVLDNIRFVTDDVAVIMAMSAVVRKGSPIPEHPQVLWSATLLKKNGTWQIVSFHNADIEILDNAVSRANSSIPVEVMYKSWYDTDFSTK